MKRRRVYVVFTINKGAEKSRGVVCCLGLDIALVLQSASDLSYRKMAIGGYRRGQPVAELKTRRFETGSPILRPLTLITYFQFNGYEEMEY